MKQKVAETWLISNQYVWSVIIAQWKSDGQILLRELHLSRTNHYRGQPRTDESIISINRVFTCSEQNRLPTSHIISVEFTVENSKGQSGTPLRETITCLFLDTSTNSISFCHRVRSYWLLSTPKKSTVEKLLTSALTKPDCFFHRGQDRAAGLCSKWWCSGKQSKCTQTDQGLVFVGTKWGKPSIKNTLLNREFIDYTTFIFLLSKTPLSLDPAADRMMMGRAERGILSQPETLRSRSG